MSKSDGLPPITCSPQRNLRSPAPPVRGFFFRRRRAIYGEAMNTIAKVAVVAVIVLFTSCYCGACGCNRTRRLAGHSTELSNTHTIHPNSRALSLAARQAWSSSVWSSVSERRRRMSCG